MSDFLVKALSRLVPGCFIAGAGIEWFMVKVPIGGQTFYDVAKRKEAERRVERMGTADELEVNRESRRQRLIEKYGDIDK